MQTKKKNLRQKFQAKVEKKVSHLSLINVTNFDEFFKITWLNSFTYLVIFEGKVIFNFKIQRSIWQN